LSEGALYREVLETHELLEVGEIDLSGRTVALFGDDDLNRSLALPGLVHFRPMQQHDGVRVLLDGSRFAQVRQSRLMVLPILGRPIDLGQGNQRHLQLSRQELESSRYSGHLLLAILAAVVRL